MPRDSDEQGPKKRDPLVVFDVVVKIIIACVGLWATLLFQKAQNRRQDYERKLKEIDTINTLLPAIFSEDSLKAGAAYFVMRADTSLRLVYQTAQQLPSEMQRRLTAAIAYRDVANAARTSVRADTSNPFFKPLEDQFTSGPGSSRNAAGQSGSGVPGSAAVPPGTGWIYLGAFSGGRWQTRYLAFAAETPPRTLVGKRFTVREETGALNVRSAMLSVPNVLPPTVDSIAPGHSVAVEDVREWVDRGTPTGYMWAKIRF